MLTPDEMKAEFKAWATSGACILGAVGFFVAAAQTCCATPAILVDPHPSACGEYPEWCNAEHTQCCSEGNACTVNGCEYTGHARDAGAE